MNLSVAGYHTLMILSVVDGNYHQQEGRVIVDWLAKHYKLSIDIDKENEALREVPKERIPCHYKSCCEWLAKNVTQEQILDLIGFMHRLIHADNKLHEDEVKFFKSTCKFFGVDSTVLLMEESIETLIK